MLRRRVNVDQAVTEVGPDLIYGTPKNHSRRSFNPAMDRLLEIYPELTRLTPHDLRHTAASLAISAGANVKAVQKMLGHVSAVMTLDVYADLFADDLDAVGEALSKAGDPASVGKNVGKPWARRIHRDRYGPKSPVDKGK